jgi:hypothetical protein
MSAGHRGPVGSALYNMNETLLLTKASRSLAMRLLAVQMGYCRSGPRITVNKVDEKYSQVQVETCPKCIMVNLFARRVSMPRKSCPDRRWQARCAIRVLSTARSLEMSKRSPRYLPSTTREGWANLHQYRFSAYTAHCTAVH